MKIIETDLLIESSICVGEAYLELSHVFERCGILTSKLDARLLICESLQISHEEFMARPDKAVSGLALESIREAGRRRINREPVSRILGRREFWSQTYIIDEFTLDPRPDSETLIAYILELISERGNQKDKLKILDLGTGSGCLLLSLLLELPCSFGIGTDISEYTLKAAELNSLRLGLENRARFIKSDWWKNIEGKFDIILSNPPYIKHEEIARLDPEVATYDPSVALDGGNDGLEAFRNILGPINNYMNPNSIVLVEVGTGQKNDVETLCLCADLEIIGEKRDLAGNSRCVAAKMR